MAVQRLKINAYSCAWYKWHFFLFISSLSMTAGAVTAKSPAERLLGKFGTNYSMNAAQIADLFDKMGISNWDYDGSKEERCSSSEYFFKEYSKSGVVNESALEDFCPAVLYELSKEACQRELEEEEEEGGGNEDEGKAWGFGILFVTVISVGSLLGAVVVPIMHKKIFQTVLMIMISLAVGVLSGSGIFHLIPHALELGHDDLSYMWKLVMVAVGIYVFFLLESIMKMYLYFKALESDPNANGITGHGIDNHGHSHHLSFQEPGEITHVPETFPGKTDEKKPNGVGVTQKKKQIATVAWMIIIGDGLHNFIDGLAIGVSCSTSILSGLSTSLAICCEELPHELGDFAILLNSGMTYKQAMLANFGSACLCYVGLIVGLILGFKTSAVHYIYGIAGGMFLYISLVDMLPESIRMIHGLAGKSKKRGFKMLFIQNFFILFGMGAMLLLSFYAHKIKKAKW